MKYLITDNNIKSSTGTRDIPYFKSLQERDEWVSTELLNGSTIEDKFSTLKPLNTQILNLTQVTISVKFDATLVNKNYIIIEEKTIFDGYLFYHIRDKDFEENANMVELQLELDPLLTYWDVIYNLRDFELGAGHSDFRNYFSYEFNIGNRTVDTITKINRNYEIDDGYTVDENNGVNFIAFDEVAPPEKGKTDRWKTSVNKVSRVYRTFIGTKEGKEINITSNLSGSGGNRLVATNGEEFSSYINEARADNTFISFQVTPYNFFKPTSTGTRWLPADSTGVFRYDFVDSPGIGLKEAIAVKEWNTELAKDANSYDIDLTKYNELPHNFGLLQGLEDEKIVISGIKEINWPFDKKDFDNETLTMRLGSSLTPDENKCFITWNEQPYTFTDENTFDVNLELGLYADQLNTRNANSPISTKLEKLQFIQSAATGAGKGFAVGSVPGAIAGATTGAFNTVIGNSVTRGNLKNAPGTSTANTNGYYLLDNYDYPAQPVIHKFDYPGNVREGIFRRMYRYGIVYDQSLIVSNYEAIKRPKFNFISINNFSESDYARNLPDDVVTLLDGVMQNVRIWNEGYLDFDDNYAGNGDKI